MVEFDNTDHHLYELGEYAAINHEQIVSLSYEERYLLEMSFILRRYNSIPLAMDDPDSEIYHDNMPGMTLDEFNACSDKLIGEAKADEQNA